MKDLIDFVGFIMLMVCWVLGMVLAKGFWSTTFAIFFPPWGWYLIAERFYQTAGCVVGA